MTHPTASRASHRAGHLVLAAALVVAVFAADVGTGTELSLSLFYLFPVGYTAWFCGLGPALAMAVMAGVGWYAAATLPSSRHLVPAWLMLWNAAIESGVNSVVAAALAGMRRGLDRERALHGELEAAWRGLDREQQVVGALQRGLLPARPPELPGWRIAVHYATSTRAGGDYYDFFALPDGALGVLVADASGHGTPAAVVMAMLRTLLHTEPPTLADPRTVLTTLDRRLSGNLPRGHFATACWVTLGPSTGALAYARAGHCPPLVLRASGVVERLDAGGGLPLGLDVVVPRYADGASSELAACALAPGDTLLLYTDGLTEATAPDAEMFGEERVRALLAEHAGADPTQLLELLLDAVGTHRRGAELADDLTVLALGRRPAA